LLTKIRAYSSWQSAPTLFLDEDGGAESDLVQITNVDGLSPIKDTEPNRNIILTVHPNPDWDTWTPEKLRELLYSYFMPTQIIRLVFSREDKDDVEIYGYVESFDANPFSKDPEYLASLICDPYFTAITPTVLAGADGDEVDINYSGNVDTPIYLRVNYISGTAPDQLVVSVDNPDHTFMRVNQSSIVSGSRYFELNTAPGNKYVQFVGQSSGVITNLMVGVTWGEGSDWPVLSPGLNKFKVTSKVGVQHWELTYYEKFGGL
jgi:hypothetical protein